MDTRTKILGSAEAASAVSSVAATGKCIVVARGSFEVLRAEHCRLLAEAKRQGTHLVVVVHDDHEPRPKVLQAASRAQMMAALAVVDHVVVCDEAGVEALISGWNTAAVVDVEQGAVREVIAHVLQRQSSV